MAKNIFDKQLDRSVIQLTADEKEELRRKLQETHSKMKSREEEGKKTVAVSDSGSVSVFRIIWNFILSLTFNIPFKKTANISLSRVREIKKHMNNLGILFYDFKSNAVTSEFALYLLDIYRGARSIYEIFVNPKEERAKEFYLKFFFENILSESTQNVLKDLSRENLERIFYDENIQNKRDYLKQKQKDFQESLRKYDLKQVQEILLPLEQLLNIFQHFDFQGFFSLFGHFQNGQLSVDFQRVEPEKVLPYLFDLGSVLRVVTEQEILPKAKSALESSNQQMKEEGYKTDGEYLPVKFINKVLLMSRKLIRFNIVDYMIQYITMDETKAGGFIKFERFIINRYLNLVLNKSNKNFNQIEEEKAKEFLIRNILHFFEIQSEKELNYPGIYNPETKKYFENRDIKAFEYVKPVSILLSFLKKHYEGFLREVINTIVVKGVFVKKAQGENFSIYYYTLDDQVEKLKAFIQEELVSSDRNKNIIIELMAVSKELTPVEKKTVKDKLKKYDIQLGEIIENITETLFKIFTFLKDIIKDFKKRHPDILANIQNLQGVRTMSFHSALEKAIEILESFFQIMRNFIIIRAEMNDVFQKLETMGK